MNHRKWKPTPRPSGPPSLRRVAHTMFDTYRKPHASSARRPSTSIAFGTHVVMLIGWRLAVSVAPAAVKNVSVAWVRIGGGKACHGK